MVNFLIIDFFTLTIFYFEFFIIFAALLATLEQSVLFRKQAQMAKLVDALVSGTSVSNDVQVRVLFWAQPHLAQMVKLVDTPA